MLPFLFWFLRQGLDVAQAGLGLMVLCLGLLSAGIIPDLDVHALASSKVHSPLSFCCWADSLGCFQEVCCGVLGDEVP